MTSWKRVWGWRPFNYGADPGEEVSFADLIQYARCMIRDEPSQIDGSPDFSSLMFFDNLQNGISREVREGFGAERRVAAQEPRGGQCARCAEQKTENICETSTSSVEPSRKILPYCPHCPIKKGRMRQMGQNRTYIPGFACGGLHVAPKGAWAHLGSFAVIWEDLGYLGCFGVKMMGGGGVLGSAHRHG